MSRWWGQSPWPQWRSHWHVWHAWPCLAQALVLCAASMCLTGWGSFYLSADLWRAWWQHPQAQQAMAARLETLRTQLRQQRAQIQALEALPHPSGMPWPAWQTWPANPTSDVSAAAQLAQQHGLQAQMVNDHQLQWRGSLPQLLAAWQQWPQRLPRQRVQAFELTRLADPAPGPANPAHPWLQLDITWAPAAPLASAEGLRPQPSPNSALAAPPSHPPVQSGPQVWHNPFAVHGLRLALPPQAASWLAADAPGQGRALEEHAWVGMLSQPGQQRALVRTQGRVQALAVGQAWGQNWGRVVEIGSDHLVLQEWHPQARGQWQSQRVRFPGQVQP